MAGFNAANPISQVSPSPTILPGVEDNSKSIAIKGNNAFLSGLGDIANSAYKGAVLADVEKQQEAVINDYVTSHDNLSNAEAALNSPISVLNSTGSPGITLGTESTLSNSYTEKVRKYQMAKDQGVMSQQEFSDRVLAVTREAVNKSPGLYQDILNHTQRVLGLSGIEDRVKRDATQEAAQQKQAAEYVKNIREQADHFNISYDSANLNNSFYVHDLEKQVNDSKMSALAFESLKQSTEKGTLLNTQQKDAFVKSGGLSSAVNGGIDQINSLIRKQAQFATDPSSYSGLKLAINNSINEVKRTILLNPNYVQYANDPAIKEQVAFMNDYLKSMSEAVDSFSSGKDLLTFAENRYNIKKANDSYAVQNIDGVNVEAIKLVSQLSQNNPYMTEQLKDVKGGGAQRLAANINTLVTGVGKLIGVQAPSSTGKSEGINLVTPLIANAPNNIQAAQALTNYQKAVNEGITNPQSSMFKNDSDKFKFLDDLVKEYAKPENRDGLGKLDDEGKLYARQNVELVGKTTTQKLINEINSTKESVQFIPNSDGTITITSPNKQLETALTTTYGIRINNSIKALQAITGDKDALDKYLLPTPVKEPTTTLDKPVSYSEPINKDIGYGLRNDKVSYKGKGFLGVIKASDGSDVTEYSAQSNAVQVNGKRIEFPTIVPTLTKDEVDTMVNDIIPNKKQIPEEIMQKAIAHAKQRISQSKSVFAQEGEQTNISRRSTDVQNPNLTSEQIKKIEILKKKLSPKDFKDLTDLGLFSLPGQ